MNGVAVSENKTIVLTNELVKRTQEYEQISKAVWWRQPIKSWRRGRKKQAILTRSQLILGELASRYEGIMFQMFYRSRSTPPTLTNSQWEQIQDTVWLLVGDELRTMSDHRTFSGVLWKAYLSQLGVSAAILALRPKFMLRQFVDEMPSSDQRGILRATAYGANDSTQRSGKELVRLIKSALSIFHAHVLAHATEVQTLTAGEFKEAEVQSYSEPFAPYQTWLFHS
jgi:hypothetical protein